MVLFRIGRTNQIYLKDFESTLDKIKDKLKEIYGKEYYEKLFLNYPKKEIAELVQNISNGVPISTPVFDGASLQI